ncbi:MAG: DUF1385 domain-containing protein [Lachnospiraceae bacterium]|nr:DUF1385 domain-containing protein [Lachnospiraceae bacterium]
MNNCAKKCYSGIGGQAVIEGIMMKNKDEYSVAVRKSNGEIVVKKDKYIMLSQKYKILGLPFVRGIFSMVDSLILGSKTLEYSASFFDDEGSSENESKIDKWLNEHINEKTMGLIMSIITVISVVFALIVFSVLPAGIGTLFKNIVKTNSHFLTAFVEGIVRILIFILYIKLISRMDEIKRTFEYHGSEHKCINCIENGWDLTVDNVLKASKEHKRCGTSFLVYVMVISIFLFMFINPPTLMLKFLSRIILIPVVAGVSYEVLRLAGRFDNKLINIISRPGMWMQGLTTLEPDAKEVEVAIRAVEEVFDWKSFKKEHFDK